MKNLTLQDRINDWVHHGFSMENWRDFDETQHWSALMRELIDGLIAENKIIKRQIDDIHHLISYHGPHYTKEDKWSIYILEQLRDIIDHPEVKS